MKRTRYNQQRYWPSPLLSRGHKDAPGGLARFAAIEYILLDREAAAVGDGLVYLVTQFQLTGRAYSVQLATGSRSSGELQEYDPSVAGRGFVSYFPL